MRKQLFSLLLISSFSIQAMNSTDELEVQIKQLSGNIALCATVITTAALIDVHTEFKEYPVSQFPYSRHRKEQKLQLLKKAMLLQSAAILNQSLVSTKQ
jgi:hypothetical protein